MVVGSKKAISKNLIENPTRYVNTLPREKIKLQAPVPVDHPRLLLD